MAGYSHPLRDFAGICLAVLLALGAIWFGGATQVPVQAAVIAGVGLLFVIAPPRRWPDRTFSIAALGLLALALVAFLPSGWFVENGWRVKAAAAGIELPHTLSAQPRITAECVLLFIAGLSWVAWLSTFPWERHVRRRTIKFLAVGMIAMACVVVYAWYFKWRVPHWLYDKGYGPFPNRNHTSHVLALGGMLALACAATEFRRKWWGAIPWALGAICIVAALVVNYSRGGLLLFFGAVTLWAAMAAWQKRSWKRLVIGSSAILVAVALVLIFGGRTAERFAGREDSDVGFRAQIWSDTLKQVADGPWCGVGLGNFAPVFPFYRKASVTQSAVLHPESDFLQLAAETGWLGVLLALIGCVALARKAFPLVSGTQKRLRGAALAAALGAIGHAMIDVPGHRIGSFFFAAFVLILAGRDRQSVAPSRLPMVCSTLLGFWLLGISWWWLQIPNDAKIAEEHSRAGRFEESIQAADRALARTPMNWGMYFTRAGAHACSGRILSAIADFKRAKMLEPHYAMIPFYEAVFWQQHHPELAAPAWSEHMKRLPPAEARQSFESAVKSATDAQKRADILSMAEDHPALQLLWFKTVPPAEAMARIEDFRPLVKRWNGKDRAAFEARVSELEKLPREQSPEEGIEATKP